MNTRVLFLDDSGKPDANHASNAVVIAGFSVPSEQVTTLSRRVLGAKGKFFPKRGQPTTWEIKAADVIKPNPWNRRSNRDFAYELVRIVGSLDGAPILWERGGATTSLALLPGGTSGATAYAISDDGRHVVGTAHDGGTVSRVVLPPGGGPVIIEEPRRVPVSWNVDDGTVIAMTIERGAARDVSNDGVAVGELQLGIPQVVEVTAGFRWDSGRGSQFVPNDDLGSSLPWVQGSAAISADGSTLVGRTFGPPPPGSTVSGIFERAYVWNGSPGEETSLPTDGLALIDVPASLSGYSESEATGVSADGSTIVGGYYRDGIRFGSLSPFIWTREGGFQDLELLLHTLGVPTDGWELLGATDVSADGKTIIGMGRTRNELGRRSDTVWIAVIPEPSVSLLIAVGLSILAGTARARDGR